MTTVLEPREPMSAVMRKQAPPARRWWFDLSGAAALASLTIVVALWISNRGIQALGGPDHGLTSLGRLAGLLAADLMLVQVALMARIPWVTRLYGQDVLARRHRLAGFTSFWLLVSHVILIALGYAATLHTGAVSQVRTLLLTYPGVLLATGGTGLIVLVIVTSIRAARRRVRYESWHLIHLYAYVGIGLALPHQLWTGADFINSGVARAYWWGVYALTLGCVLAFRLCLPIWRSMRHRLVVESVVTEAPGVVSVYMTGRALDRLPVRAGQFFIWRFLGGRGWSRGHPYSLSASPTGERLRITVKDLGDGSAQVASLRPGVPVLIEGPYGVLTAERSGQRPLVMFAAGVGITAIRALLEDSDVASRPVTVLYRTGNGDAVFAEELDAMARQDVRIVPLVGHRPPHPSFLPAHLADVPDAVALRRLVPDVRDRDAYICGPPTWMAAVRRALATVGVPTPHIHVEDFAW